MGVLQPGDPLCDAIKCVCLWLQDAVTDYGLTDLHLEMFIDTGYHPAVFPQHVDPLNNTIKCVCLWLQDAVTDYGLTDLQLEMFINTCDHPQSFYSGHWPDRSGYPIMSTGFTVDTKDIPIPDPLDLTPDYTPDLSLQVSRKENERRKEGKKRGKRRILLYFRTALISKLY